MWRPRFGTKCYYSPPSPVRLFIVGALSLSALTSLQRTGFSQLGTRFEAPGPERVMRVLRLAQDTASPLNENPGGCGAV